VCDRFLSPSTVRADGSCPTCGRAVDPGRAHGATTTAAATVGPGRDVSVPAAPNEPGARAVPEAGKPEAEEGGEDDEDEPLGPLPWHLKLLTAALALYLGYRAFQGIEWVVHQL
jgi:hypothetical protein